MRLKMKNRSHGYDMTRPSPRHGHKYTIYKMCLSLMMAISIKQHLSNIWRSIYETGAELKKSVSYKKSLYVNRKSHLEKGEQVLEKFFSL